MPIGVRYRCSRCNKDIYYLDFYPNSNPRWYILPDSRRVHIGTSLRWCKKCKDIRECEYLPPLDLLKKQLEEVEARTTGQDDFNAKEAANIRARIAWRETRKSPARCLRCERTNILSSDNNKIIHDGCGGTFERDHTYKSPSIDGVFLRGENVYDVEGRHLRFVPYDPPPPTDYRKLAFRLLFVFLLIGAIVLLCVYAWG